MTDRVSVPEILRQRERAALALRGGVRYATARAAIVRALLDGLAVGGLLLSEQDEAERAVMARRAGIGADDTARFMAAAKAMPTLTRAALRRRGPERAGRPFPAGCKPLLDAADDLLLELLNVACGHAD